MAYIFRLPEMGEGLTEGDVASWLVKEGEAIKADDPLIEIQTDKSTTQLVSPVDGTVKKLFVKEDDHVEKGDKLAEIDDGKPGISTNVESEDDDDELIQAVKKLLKVKNPRLQLQILLQKIILQRVE